MAKTKLSAAGVVVDLPPHLDLTAAAPLAERFLAARGEQVTIDASHVERLGGQCLQVLLSVVATWKAEMTPIEIASPSEAFRDGLTLLGLSLETLIEKEIMP